MRACALAAALCCATAVVGAEPRTLEFGGQTWVVRADGRGGPGPCNWRADNVRLDAQGQLHLKITSAGGQWYCAEVYTRERLGFGQYDWQVTGALDKLDRNVVLGLFHYAGPDGQNELDIEVGQWGNAKANAGHFSVYPGRGGLRYSTHTFPLALKTDRGTARYRWQSQSAFFQLLDDHRTDDAGEVAQWRFAPERWAEAIPQQPLPLHMNLWLQGGKPPADGQEVEVVIKSFAYQP